MACNCYIWSFLSLKYGHDVLLSSSLNRMTLYVWNERWPCCSVVGQWIMGYSGGLWGWGDGSPFCVWSRSGYIHAHRATAVVHLVEALITTPPHLHATHTHTHYSNTKHTVLLTWDFLDCCSLSDLFISIIYFSHFCTHVPPNRNEPRFLLLQHLLLTPQVEKNVSRRNATCHLQWRLKTSSKNVTPSDLHKWLRYGFWRGITF